MNIGLAILIKLLSVLLFAMMSALVRFVGDVVPLGQVVFFRSAFAILPVLAIYAWRGESAPRFAPGVRSATSPAASSASPACSSTSPRSRACRWSMPPRFRLRRPSSPSRSRRSSSTSGCALIAGRRSSVGFCGVVVMLWPYLDVPALIGSRLDRDHRRRGLCAITAAFTNAGAVIQTRRLTDSETTASIVFYFSLICTLAGPCNAAVRLGDAERDGACGAHRDRRNRRAVPYFSHRELPLGAGFGGGAVRLRGAAMGFRVRLCAVRRGPDDPCLCRAPPSSPASGLFVIWRERQLARARGKKVV